jgi:hypothetical protein
VWVVLATILSRSDPGAFWKAVHKNNPYTIKKLKQVILAAIITVSEEILAAVE